MQEEKVFDFEKYIYDRLKEIDDLDERREAKKILWEGLGRLLRLTETKYRELEDRIYHELPMPENNYTITTALVSTEDYDPINGLLFPMDAFDFQHESASEENKACLYFYIEADDGICNRFLALEKIAGRYQKEDKEIPLTIKKNNKYLQKLAKLYETFTYNLIPWATVHTGYLERFFYLELSAEEKLSFDDIEIDWGEAGPYIRKDVFPLWNVEDMEFRMSDYMIPGLDGLYYEHCIKLDGKQEADGYLVNIHEDIINIRYEKGLIIIKTKKEEMGRYEGYHIHRCEKRKIKEIADNILNNERKDSFAARYQKQSGGFIQSRLEMMRRIHEIAGECGVVPEDFRIEEEAKGYYLEADMNRFIAEPSFPKDTRKNLVFYFKKTESKNYLYEAHIRYLLSELQLEYMEYHCVGMFI